MATQIVDRPGGLGDRWLLLAFLTLALSAYLSSTTAQNANSDAKANSFLAWHLAHTASPFVEDGAYPEIPGPDYIQPNEAGRTVVARTPGPSLVAAPFYLGTTDDPQRLSYRQGSVAAAVMTAVAMALLLSALLPHLPAVGAVGAAAVVAFTTPVWSVSADQLWTHGLTLLSIAGSAASLSRERWWSAGTFLAVGILARPHIALVAAVVGVGLAWSRRSPRPALAIGLTSSLGLILLAAWNRLVFGQWSVTSGYAQGLADVVPGAGSSSTIGYLENLAGFLISPDRGLVIWTPLLLLASVTAWKNRRHVPDWTLWLAGGGLTYSLVQLALNDFTGGSGFNGYRLALELLVALAPWFAIASARAGTFLKRAAPLVVAYQAGMTFLSAAVGGYWVRQEDVWTDNSVARLLRGDPVAGVATFLIIAASAGWLAHRVLGRLDCANEPRAGGISSYSVGNPAE